MRREGREGEGKAKGKVSHPVRLESPPGSRVYNIFFDIVDEDFFEAAPRVSVLCRLRPCGLFHVEALTRKFPKDTVPRSKWSTLVFLRAGGSVDALVPE